MYTGQALAHAYGCKHMHMRRTTRCTRRMRTHHVHACACADPRFTSTVRTYEKVLVQNGFMLRYTNADDFGETTSAFLICSFWWAEALALMVGACACAA